MWYIILQLATLEQTAVVDSLFSQLRFTPLFSHLVWPDKLYKYKLMSGLSFQGKDSAQQTRTNKLRSVYSSSVKKQRSTTDS